MQEIYILIKSEGIYDSQTSFPVAAFMNRQAAEKECKRLNDEMDDLESLSTRDMSFLVLACEQ